ncbi:MAG TPA: hypothetical protein VLE99_01200 [Candidatus Saccharimonadales bacterium]|nr:hypothetical protein [Candidatus Saccharimonadales bacterium]
MKELLGGMTIFLSLVGYIPYLRDVIKGKTKPHAFSWIVWTLVTFVVGIAQLAAGAGWGTVHNLTTGFIGLVILFYALRNKDKDIKQIDIVLFILALLSIPLWVVTKNPVYSIILITGIDILAFIPTLRKTWYDPTSETLVSYFLAGLKYGLALGAIGAYKFSTLLYPIVLIAMNTAIVTIIITRCKVVQPSPQPHT